MVVIVWEIGQKVLVSDKIKVRQMARYFVFTKNKIINLQLSLNLTSKKFEIFYFQKILAKLKSVV